MFKKDEMRIYVCGAEIQNSQSGGVFQTITTFKYIANKYHNVEYLYNLNNPSPYLRNNPFLFNLWSCFFLIRKLRGNGSIIIFDYATRLHVILFCILVRLFLKTRVVIIVQATYFSLRKSFVKNFLDKVISKIFLRTAHLVITSGKSLIKQLNGLGVPLDMIRTHYPALREEFVNFNCPNRIEKSEGRLKLLFVGRVNPIKGVEYLIKSISLLNKEDVELIIIGPYMGPRSYKDYIEFLIKSYNLEKCVTLRGRIDDLKELIEIYRTTDVFVCPSVWDTSPITVIEAMSCGLPIIASGVGGIPEWVKDGINGILVPVRDFSALARAIQKLIDNPFLRKKMGQESYQEYLRYPYKSWDLVAEEFYKSISGVFMEK